MNPLDNPIWEALNTKHAHFARVRGQARKFPSEVSVLSGLAEPTPENYAALAALLRPQERVGLFLQNSPDPPAAWTLTGGGPLVQMVYPKEKPALQSRARVLDFVPLTDADVPEMLALTKLTKPGPFSTRTHEMGEYLGIRRDGILPQWRVSACGSPATPRSAQYARIPTTWAMDTRLLWSQR